MAPKLGTQVGRLRNKSLTGLRVRPRFWPRGRPSAFRTLTTGGPNVQIWDAYFTSQAVGRVQWVYHGEYTGRPTDLYRDEKYKVEFNIGNIGDQAARGWADLVGPGGSPSQHEYYDVNIGPNTYMQLVSFERTTERELTLYPGQRWNDQDTWGIARKLMIYEVPRPSNTENGPDVQLWNAYFTGYDGRKQIVKDGAFLEETLRAMPPGQRYKVEFQIKNMGNSTAVRGWVDLTTSGEPHNEREYVNIQMGAGQVSAWQSFTRETERELELWPGQQWSDGRVSFGVPLKLHIVDSPENQPPVSDDGSGTGDGGGGTGDGTGDGTTDGGGTQEPPTETQGGWNWPLVTWVQKLFGQKGNWCMNLTLSELLEAHERAVSAGYTLTEHTPWDNDDTPPQRGPLETFKQNLFRIRSPPCFPNLPCAFQPWCVTTRIQYTSPTIQPKPFPVRITTVTFRPFKGKMDGRVVTAFKNESQEGTKTTTTITRCKGEAGTKTEPVPGSADVDSDEWHAHTWDQLSGTVTDKFHAVFTRVRPAATLSTEATFQKTGIKDVLVAATQLLWTWVNSGQAKMAVSVHTDTTVRWNWLGKPQAKVFAANIPSVWLPADDVNIDLSFW